MITLITFEAIKDRQVVTETIPIEHPIFVQQPDYTFMNYEFKGESINSQVINWLDSIDKSKIMDENNFELIINYKIPDLTFTELLDLLEFSEQTKFDLHIIFNELKDTMIQLNVYDQIKLALSTLAISYQSTIYQLTKCIKFNNIKQLG